MPGVCASHLPGPGGYRSLGLIYEDGKDLPVGMSQAQLPGHRPDLPQLRRLPREHGARQRRRRSRASYLGMPANTFDVVGVPEVPLRLRGGSEVRRGVRRARDRSPHAREGRAAPVRSTATSSIRSPSRSCASACSCSRAGSSRCCRIRSGGRGASTRSTRPRCSSTSRSAPSPRREKNGALGFPVDLAAAAAQGHAAALGRQQHGGRGAQQERRLRHRHHAADDRPRRDRSHRGVAPDARAAEVPLSDRRGQGRPRGGDLRASLRDLPRRERPRLFRRARGQGDADPRHRHRPAPARSLHLRSRREPVDALRGLSVALQAFPQDLRLREHAARRRVAARAVPAQRLGAEPARPARARREAAEGLLSRQRRLRPGEGRLRVGRRRARARRGSSSSTRACPAIPTPATRARPTARSCLPRTRTRSSST